MGMKRKWKSRLGVSTVIANMLMIAITLSLAAILVAWAGSSYGAFTSGSQLFFQQREQALEERFVIENVFFNKTASPSTILVFVRNVGVEDINVVAVYVNGTLLTPQPAGHGSTCVFSGPSSSVKLLVGGVCEFNLQWGPPPGGKAMGNGAIFFIKVASARGNQASDIARGP
jgi:archaellum component FlaF (FlaF/FlaG flagellin family)